jgi:hypothetical protein
MMVVTYFGCFLSKGLSMPIAAIEAGDLNKVREVWTHLWKKPDAEVRKLLEMVTKHVQTIMQKRTFYVKLQACSLVNDVQFFFFLFLFSPQFLSQVDIIVRLVECAQLLVALCGCNP